MTEPSTPFAEVVESHWEAVCHFAYRLCGTRHDAEDIAQQTFYQAFRAYGKFAGRASVRTWLIRIAIHVSTRVLRRRDRAPGPLPDEVVSSTSSRDPLEREEARATLERALEQIRPIHRLVLTLFCVDGLSHREIADLLGCPEGTVWSRLHNARIALSARLAGKELI